MTDIGPSTCNYQRDNRSYPIELQLWCGQDYQFNIWSHRYVYNIIPPRWAGRCIRHTAPECLPTEQAFLARLTQEVENRG